MRILKFNSIKTTILAFLLFFSMNCQDRIDKITSNNFIGTWTLVKCIAIQEVGVITFPYGEKPIGQISYDKKGNVMVQIMKQEIVKFMSDNPFQGIPEEIIPAYNGFLAYYGTYKVMSDSNFIIHNIKGCSFPNWVGQKQKRHYKFENNRLILTTPAINSVQFELTWEKN